MAIPHKFLNVPPGGFGGDNRFWTENGILRCDAYKPEVLVIGTYNPLLDGHNEADFFYGRNYFWPAFAKLFVPHAHVHPERRFQTNAPPPPPEQRVPTLDGILDLCIRLRFSFADLIQEVFHVEGNAPVIGPDENGLFHAGDEPVDLFVDGQQDQNGHHGLAWLNDQGLVNWNMDAIVAYLGQHPSIRAVYLTIGYQTPWIAPWTALKHHAALPGRTFTRLRTPSRIPQGGGGLAGLLHHWVHDEVAPNQHFGHLDHQWLGHHGVDPNNF
jgi:hypothetical protein